MKAIQPIKVFTVKYEGENITIYREEIMRDETLADALTSYERLIDEVILAEYEMRKLVHARISMMNELQNLVFKYVKNKENPPKEDKEDGEGGNPPKGDKEDGEGENHGE